MKLMRNDERSVAVVDVEGKLFGGLDESDRFHGFFKAILEEGTKYIVVDLNKTSWANSLGIGMLIGAYTSVRNAGGELVLAHAVDRIKKILVVTKLILIFKTFETLDEAVDYLLKQEEAEVRRESEVGTTAGDGSKRHTPSTDVMTS